MKKNIHLLVIVSTIMLVFFLAECGHAEWVLYDNFDSGVINPELWELDDSSAVITVENGEAKFELLADHPNDPSFLIFKKNPGKIKAIEAKIRIESCNSDVRAQVAGYTGNDGGNHPVYNSVGINCGQSNIDGLAVAEEFQQAERVRDLYVFFKCILKEPGELAGRTFTVMTTFTPGSITYRALGIGHTLFLPSPRLFQTKESFKGIGTSSESGDGACIVYFDEVYVLY